MIPEIEQDDSTEESVDFSNVEFSMLEALEYRTELDRNLVQLQRSAEILDIVKADAVHMLGNVRSTCDLTEQVSSKVQVLHLAQYRVGGSTVEVRLPFPVNSNEEIISVFREGLEKGRANGRTIKLANTDHITSMLFVLMQHC